MSVDCDKKYSSCKGHEVRLSVSLASPVVDKLKSYIKNECLFKTSYTENTFKLIKEKGAKWRWKNEI